MTNLQIQSACNLFGVPPEVFEPEKTINDLFNRLDEHEQIIAQQQLQIEENRRRIIELEQQKEACETEKAGLRSLIRSRN